MPKGLALSFPSPHPKKKLKKSKERIPPQTKTPKDQKPKELKAQRTKIQTTMMEMDITPSSSLSTDSLPSASSSSSSSCPHLQMIRAQIKIGKERVELLSSELMEASASLQGLYRQLKAHSCTSHAPVSRVTFSSPLASSPKAAGKVPAETPEDLFKTPSPWIEEEKESPMVEREEQEEQEEQHQEEQHQEEQHQEEQHQEEQHQEEQEQESLAVIPLRQSQGEKESHEHEEKEEGEEESEELEQDEEEGGLESPSASFSRIPSSFDPSLNAIAESLEAALQYIESQKEKELSQKELSQKELSQKETSQKELSQKESSQKEMERSPEVVVETLPAHTLNFDFLDAEESEEEQEQEDQDQLEKERTSPLKRKRSEHGQLSPPITPLQKRLREDPSQPAVREKEAQGEALSQSQSQSQSQREKAELRPQGPNIKGLRKIWKRHNVTRRLQRLATNGEELQEVLRKMIRQVEEKEEKRERRRRAFNLSEAERRRIEREKARTLTMEETVKEGCTWLLANLFES